MKRDIGHLMPAKAALQQPAAPVHVGRKTLPSKPHTLPDRKRQPGRGVPSLGLLLVGFPVECGRVAFFFNCTLKERSLEPSLKTGVRSQRRRGEGRTLGGVREEGCNRAATFGLHEKARALWC